MAETMTGRVKWFSGSKGFGYITPDDPKQIPDLEAGDQGVYVHITDIPSGEPLRRNQQVEFEVGFTKKGKPKALNVQLVVAEEADPLEKWLRILLPGHAPIAEIAAFLCTEEAADETGEEIWVPDTIWDSEWGQENWVEEDPWPLRQAIVREAFGSWLFEEAKPMDADEAWELHSAAHAAGGIFFNGPHTDFFQIRHEGKWIVVALEGEEGSAYYRELPGNEPLPKEIHE